MSCALLDDNSEATLSSVLQLPKSPDLPSLVPDVDFNASPYTVSSAPPQLSNYVNLTEHDFRTPTAPATASSYRKRLPDDNGSRSSLPTKRSRLSESTFTNSCREQLQAAYGGCCACAVTYYLHAAHVMDRATPDFAKLRRQGIVSFETLGDYDNAIFLCPADHAAFDARDPGLVIVPTHLNFFIEHETRWQAEMNKMTPPKARVPVQPSEYAAYCAGSGMSDEHTKGLYTAYMLVDYKDSGRIGPPRTFEWHGDPGAILWKVQHLANHKLESLSLLICRS